MTAESTEPTVVERCDVCIVGAGLAGMNALFVASRYLARDQKIILVDRRPRVGGMWVDTYPYVRLHQPHPMFTAGNIEWTLGKDRSHLATKGEVLDHFEHCLDVIRQSVKVEGYFGWSMESHVESGDGVRVTCRSADGRQAVIETKRLINASGFGIEPNDPLEFSSSLVQSVSPDSCDVLSGDIAASDAPVWIVGGGKTAMDTAYALITDKPGREVNMIAGAGTFFNDRDAFFPTGIKRWWRGSPVSTLAAEVTTRYDGTNEDAVWDWHRDTYGQFVTPQPGNFLLGVISGSEIAAISAGLNDVIVDYLTDVVDRAGRPELVLRSGATKTIQSGSWLVNCTGYLDREPLPYEPYVSAGGNVTSIGLRSATTHLSSFSGYFQAHLMFLDKLGELPLYELDGQDLRAKSRKAFPYLLLTVAQYNLSLISDAVPGKVFQELGLDFDRWYPLPRRLIGTAKFLRTHRRNREIQRKTLDTARERLDIRCGPLQSVRR